jgi:hypothetical protein
LPEIIPEKHLLFFLHDRHGCDLNRHRFLAIDLVKDFTEGNGGNRENSSPLSPFPPVQSWNAKKRKLPQADRNDVAPVLPFPFTLLSSLFILHPFVTCVVAAD